MSAAYNATMLMTAAPSVSVGKAGLLPQALVRRLETWEELSSSDIVALTRLEGVRLELRRGDHPLCSSDEPGAALLIINGWAARYGGQTRGNRVITSLLLPGEILPPPLLDDPMSIRMLSRGEAWRIPAPAMARLRENHRLRRALRDMDAVRKAIAIEWLVNVGSQKAEVRLAHLLCELSVRMKQAGLFAQQSCELPLLQADLACALALSKAHLNVALQCLRRMDLINASAKRLTILNWPRLKLLAEFDDGYLLPYPRNEHSPGWLDLFDHGANMPEEPQRYPSL